jgi:hypothetical protein
MPTVPRIGDADKGVMSPNLADANLHECLKGVTVDYGPVPRAPHLALRTGRYEIRPRVPSHKSG